MRGFFSSDQGNFEGSLVGKRTGLTAESVSGHVYRGMRYVDRTGPMDAGNTMNFMEKNRRCRGVSFCEYMCEVKTESDAGMRDMHGESAVLYV